jgi:uncharacterized protein (TIGR02466 family)
MDNSDFHCLWPTLLLKRVLPSAEHANRALAEFILELEKSHAQLTTDYREQNLFERRHPAVGWLNQCVSKTVRDYLNESGIDYTVDWSLQGWANINRRGDYHNLHNHPHSYLSGTYYVAIPEQPENRQQRGDLNPGAISFFDPRSQANMNAIANDGQVDPEFRVQPEPGMILLWPSFLHHMVHPNFSDSPRISISFNVVLKWRAEYVPRH